MGAWDTPKQSMPLAAGYLKAAILSDPELSQAFEVTICNFGAGTSVADMAHSLFQSACPDILGFSVLGWNFRAFCAIAETYKQLRPDGWVVFGGNHVANQGARVFHQAAEVDIVVNGEGEIVFSNLLRHYVNSRHSGLAKVSGISYRTDQVHIAATQPQPRITDLNSIPSPFLSGAIAMRDAQGAFPYDVALMETNRGCPYGCAFCYWGGAINQKVRSFDRDRLNEELSLIAYHQVPHVVLCDANFGMLDSDLHFVEDAIRLREKCGFPKTIDASWAKNKSRRFYEIVRMMKASGLRSSFTLALQTLNQSALAHMNRTNMKINEWEDLARWLGENGFDCYAELIWGSPGETYESFLQGYDRLARYTSRIAVYPLQLLPNTAFAVDRERHGFVTVRGDNDDFEYVIAHRTASIDDNARMQRILFWARVIAEHMFFRHIWIPLRVLAGIEQSKVLCRMADWFDLQNDPAAAPLKSIRSGVTSANVVSRAVRFLHCEPRAQALIDRWWREDMTPLLPRDSCELLSEVYGYDRATRPIFDAPSGRSPNDAVDAVDVDGVRYYRRGIHASFDVVDYVRGLARDRAYQPRKLENSVDHYFRAGFFEQIDSHELAAHHCGLTLDRLRPSGGTDISQPPFAEAGGLIMSP
jgi:radical SAM superfamily enzyme YgiQ (UPF0313 family)